MHGGSAGLSRKKSTPKERVALWGAVGRAGSTVGCGASASGVGFPRQQEHTGGMATLPIDEPLVTVGEYLRTVYEPDCDYVDGRVEERNVGEFDHGLLQLWLGRICS